MGTLERRVGNQEAALPWSASQEVRKFVATEVATGAPVAKDRVVVMTGVSKNVRQPTSPLRMCLKVAFLLI